MTRHTASPHIHTFALSHTYHGMSTHEKYAPLLIEHGIKPTANRLIIAEALDQSSHPLSMKDIEDRILSLDKSSISRTLSLFRTHHLVHAIDDGCTSVKYELCHSHQHKDGIDEDEHVHFHCTVCHKTICLHDTPLPQMTIPAGFELQHVNLILRGICPNCLSRKK